MGTKHLGRVKVSECSTYVEWTLTASHGKFLFGHNDEVFFYFFLTKQEIGKELHFLRAFWFIQSAFLNISPDRHDTDSFSLTKRSTTDLKSDKTFQVV